MNEKYYFIMEKIDFEVGDIGIFFSTFFETISKNIFSKNQ